MAPAIEAELRDEAGSTGGPGTFAELADDWVHSSWPDLSPSTTAGYEPRLNRIQAEFGARQAPDIKGSDITASYSTLRSNGASPAEVNKIHAVFRACLSFGCKSGDLPGVATKQASASTHHPDEITPPTDAALSVLLSDVEGEWGRAITLLAHLGLRRDEVVGLRWEDVHDDAVWVPLLGARPQGWWSDREGAEGQARGRRSCSMTLLRRRWRVSGRWWWWGPLSQS